MGVRIGTPTRARGFDSTGGTCGHGHRIHERSSGTYLPQRAALLINPAGDIVDDLQLIHAII